MIVYGKFFSPNFTQRVKVTLLSISFRSVLFSSVQFRYLGQIIYSIKYPFIYYYAAAATAYIY